MKKLFSIFCAAVLMCTAAGPAGAASVHTESGEGVTFHSDFIVRQAFDSLTDSNYFNTIGANNTITAANGSITLSLNTDPQNLYGSSGQSIQVDYDLSKGKGSTSTSSVRYRNSITASGLTAYNVPNLDIDSGYSLAFWVKAEQEVQMYVRILDADSSSTNQFMTSETFTVPAGESIVELPWSAFSPDYPDAYTPMRTRFTMPYFVIADAAETTGTLYIDNLGVYPCYTATQKQFRSTFICKQDMEAYTDIEQNLPDSSYGGWYKGLGSQVLSIGTGEDAYSGQSAKVDFSANNLASGYIRYRDFVYNKYSDEDTAYLMGSSLTFWIKTNRPLRIQLKAYDSCTGGANDVLSESGYYYIPSGESIVSIPWSDLTRGGEGYESLQQYLYNLSFFLFTISGSAATTVCIDEIGFTPTPLTHGEDFISGYSVTAANIGSVVTIATNPVRFSLSGSQSAYTGKTASLKADYDFTNKATAPIIRLNLSLWNRVSTSEYLGSGSEIAFWIMTDQEVQLRLEASVGNEQWTTQVVSSSVYTVPAGESIVRIPWTDLKYSDETATPQFTRMAPRIVLIQAEGGPDTGTVYLDEFGYYPQDDARTTENLQNAAAMLDLWSEFELGWFKALGDNLKTPVAGTDAADTILAGLAPVGEEAGRIAEAGETCGALSFDATPGTVGVSRRYTPLRAGMVFYRNQLLTGELTLETADTAIATLSLSEEIPESFLAVLEDISADENGVSAAYRGTIYAARAYQVYYDVVLGVERVVYGNTLISSIGE